MQLKIMMWVMIAWLLSVAGQAQPVAVEIYAIQGEESRSPLLNQEVSTSGIVTAVANNRFFLQTPAARSDNNLKTSDGVMVYTGSGPNVELGDELMVVGYVVEFDGQTEINASSLEITLLQSNQALPPPVVLGDQFPLGIPSFPSEWERVEGMYVSMQNATASSPSEDDGRCFINPADQRSYREAGIEYPGRNGLPVWDGNPELLRFDPVTILNIRPTVSAGMSLQTEGVIQEFNSEFHLLATSFQFSGTPVLQAVRQRENREVTVGSFNTFVLSQNASNYAVRRRKVARYIVDQMGAPDIMALQEVESSSVLNDLVNEIKQLYPDINYSPYIIGGSSSGGFSIQTCFLLSPAIQNVTVQQLGNGQFLSIGGRLHDRLPLLLEAEFASSPPIPIKVLNLHMRSLNGIEGGNSTFVRVKRHEQAISVAQMINSFQGDNLIVLGDLNAYQFSDGYVDVLSQVSGHPSLGAEYPVQAIVSPALTNHTAAIPAEDRYSFIFRGNSQLIDHILSSELKDITVKGVQFARGNADNPDVFLSDNYVPYKASDHDGQVLFLELDDPLNTSTSPSLPKDVSIQLPNPFGQDDAIQIRLPEKKRLQLKIYSTDGRLALDYNLGEVPEGRSDWMPVFNLPTGLYILMIEGEGVRFRKKVVMVN